MKRNVHVKKVMTVVAVLIIALMMLTACKVGNFGVFKKYEIKFYLDENDAAPVSTLKVDSEKFDFEGYMPTDPTKNCEEEGKTYKFLGWYFSDGTIFDYHKIDKNENLSLYAKFELVRKSFVVAFQDENGNPIKVDGKTEQTVFYGESAVAPENPTKEGHTFAGWDKDFASVKENLIVKAKFNIIVYEVEFRNEKGELIEKKSVNYGEDAVAPVLPIREGYTFVGWDKDITNVKGDIVTNAIYKISEYTVTFKNGEKTIKTQVVEHGKGAVAPENPTKEGYNFVGWDKEFDVVTSDLTVNAKFEIKVFDVKFVDEDGNVIKVNGKDVQKVEYGKSAVAPTMPEKEGYTFSWQQSFDNVKCDLIVNGKYEINVYEVKFVDGDGKVIQVGGKDVQQVEHGMSAIAPATPTKEGYNFVGWDKEFEVVTSNLTVNAKFEIKVYTVTFKSGEEILKTQQVKHGESASAPANPTKEGHTFAGWDKEFTSVKENLVVNAKFNVDTYTIGFQDEEGNFIELDGNTTISAEYGTKITAPPVAEKIGYTFIGWKYGETGFIPSGEMITATGEYVYTATYKINKHTIIIKSFEKEYRVEGVEYDSEISLSMPEITDTKLKENGLTFIEYVLDTGATVEGETMPDEDVTVNVKWKIDSIRNVELNPSVEDKQFVYGEALANYTLTFEKANERIAYGVEWFVNGSTAGSFDENRGTYNFTPSVRDCGTYTVKAVITASIEGLESVSANTSVLDFEIIKSTLTVTIEQASVTYGDSLKDVTYTVDGFVYGENESVITGTFEKVTDYVEGSDVGTYFVRGKGLSASNYEISYVVGEITVNKKNAEAKITPISVIYGEILPEIKYEFTGILDVDKDKMGTAQLETTYAQYDGVGNYDVNFKEGFAFDGEKANNYEITLVNSTVTVGKLPVSAYINNVADVVYLSKTPTFSISCDGLINGDTTQSLGKVKYDTTYTETSDVGKYEVSAEFVTDSKNYYPTISNSVSFNVTAKEVWFRGNFIKDNSSDNTLWSAELNGHIDGLPSGFAISGIIKANTNETGEYVLNGDLNDNFTVEGYEVTKDAESKTKNFALKFDFTLAIDKFVSVKINTFVGDYDGTEHGGEVVVTSDEVTDIIVEYLNGETWTTVAPKFVNTGEYVVKYRLMKDGTEMQSNTFKVVIRKIDNDFSFTQNSYTYNGQEQFIEGTVSAKELGNVRYENNSFVNVPDGSKMTITVICEETTNYEETAKTFEVVINKANYEGVTLDKFFVKVEPNKTLADSTSPKYVTFKNPSYVPRLGEQTVEVVYLADERNYNPLDTTLTVVGEKTNIEIVANDVEMNFNGKISSDDVQIAVSYKKNGAPIEYAGLSITRTRVDINVGSTYVVTLTLNDNEWYKAEAKHVAIKVKSVKYGAALYTIEDALAKSTATTKKPSVSNYLVITANTSFASSDVRIKRPDLFNGADCYKLAQNEYLLVPYDNTYEIRANVVEDVLSPTSKDAAYVTLTVPSGVNFVTEGHILVNAVRAGGAGVSGNPSGNKYGAIKIERDANITVNGGVFESLGFVHGEGKLVANSGNVYEAMAVLNFKGGSVTYAIYGDIFPINQFTLANITVDTEINRGVNYFAKAYVYASAEAQSDIKFIGTTKNEFIQINSGKVIKTFDEKTGKMILNLYGDVTLNNISLTIKVFISITASTNNKQVPLSGYIDVVAKTGSTVNVGIGVKLLPGSKFIVEKGATLNLNNGGNMFVYSLDEYLTMNKSTNPRGTAVYDGFQDGAWDYPTDSQSAWFRNITRSFNKYTPAELVVEGTLNLNAGSSFAGKITARDGGKVVINSAAKITYSIKEDFTKSEGAFKTKANYFTSTGYACGMVDGVLTKFSAGTTYVATNDGWGIG